MSYYKYVKRDEKSRVDWGAITSNLVDTLKEQEADREKQREAIDASSRATGDILSDAPQGENKAANEWILNASSDASQYLMSQNRLLKSGLLDPREFTVNRQNVEDSFKALQDVSKNAQQYYKETMDRIENNESIVGMEGAIQEQLNKFQNWSKTQAFVNPTNGKISIGMLDKDGGLSKNASEFSSIEGITNRMRSRYDRYDYSPDLQSWIDGVGKDVRVVRKKGVLTLSDASQDAGFQKALDEQVGALVDSNPIRVVSILEELGLIDGYDIDGEKTTQKGDKFNVAMKNENDGIVMPEVTDDMKAKAREFLSGQMLNMLDKEQTARTEFAPQKPTAAEVGAGMRKEERVGYVEEMTTIFTGSESEAQSALQRRIRSKNEELRDSGKDTITADSYIDGNKVVLVYSDGNRVETIGGTGNLKQDAFNLYDLLAPATAQTSARELEKYATEENISLNYSGEPRKGRIESGIGSSDINMTFDDTLVIGQDSNGKPITSTYSQFLEDELGSDLDRRIPMVRGGVGPSINSPGQVEREFNNLINQVGFMPTEMKNVLKKEGKTYGVKVSGNKMTITIGDTVKVIDDVYDDSETGGTAGVAKQVRRVVEEELNRINRSKLTGSRPKFN
jgi:hypothetical protein